MYACPPPGRLTLLGTLHVFYLLSNRRAFPGLGGRSKTKRPSSFVVPVTSKKGKQKAAVTPFLVKESWTHDFCLLSGRDAQTTPNREEMEVLRRAGLGKKKIVFPNRKADHGELSSKIESEYLKLKDGGGFELLRAIGGGSGVRPLQPIPFGSSGYSIPYLRESVCVGQAVIYIRPIQLDLNSSPIISDVSATTTPTVHVHVYHVYIKGAGEKGVERECIFPWEKQIKLNDLFNLPYSSLVI